MGSADSDGEEAVDGDETPRNQSLSGPTTPGGERGRESERERECVHTRVVLICCVLVVYTCVYVYLSHGNFHCLQLN